MAKARGASLIELRSIYERRLSEFLRVAAAIVGRREAAEDVVQEAFDVLPARVDRLGRDVL